MAIGPENGRLIDVKSAENEPRKMGAMLLLHDGSGNIFVIRDGSKLEMIGGMTTKLFVYGLEERWCVPAGGRKKNETPLETIKRELGEEVNSEIANLLPWDTLKKISPYPFVIDQVVEEENTGEPISINRIAVSVWAMEIKPDNDEWTQLSQSGKGEWQSAKDIAEHLSSFNSQAAYAANGTNVHISYEYRPQLILAAAMFCEELTAEDIVTINAALIRQGNMIARAAQLPIKNGAIGEDGNLDRNLDEQALDFLLTQRESNYA